MQIRNFITTAVAVAAAGLTVAACGGSSSGSAPSTSTAPVGFYNMDTLAVSLVNLINRANGPQIRGLRSTRAICILNPTTEKANCYVAAQDNAGPTSAFWGAGYAVTIASNGQSYTPTVNMTAPASDPPPGYSCHFTGGVSRVCMLH